MVNIQGWTHIFKPRDVFCEKEVADFYEDLIMTADRSALIASVNGTEFTLDESTLGNILRVPNEGITTVVGKKASEGFLAEIRKPTRNLNMNSEHMLKKQMQPLYQLIFELVNKVILPRAERRSSASLTDLFMIEALVSFKPINLPRIMIEPIVEIYEFKDSIHALGYGFLLTRVFDHFKVACKDCSHSTRRKTFTFTTLEECECVKKGGGVGPSSMVSNLIVAQEKSNAELEKMSVLLAEKETENALLQSKLFQTSEGTSAVPGALQDLHTKNTQLRTEVDALKQKVSQLTEQMAEDQRASLKYLDQLIFKS